GDRGKLNMLLRAKAVFRLRPEPCSTLAIKLPHPRHNAGAENRAFPQPICDSAPRRSGFSNFGCAVRFASALVAGAGLGREELFELAVFALMRVGVGGNV